MSIGSMPTIGPSSTSPAAGHLEVVKLLLTHPDINVNLKTEDGLTPFSLGCLNGHVSVIRVITEAALHCGKPL